MAVFRVERNSGYTVMSNHHLRNKELTLKAKGLLSQMLSLPEDWDYTLAGLSHINRESIDAIRTAVWELEKAGYILRRQGRDEKGKMTAIEYTIYEQPQPMLENPIPGKPMLENPTTDNPTSENPTQLNKDRSRTNLSKKEKSITDLSNTDSFPILSPDPSPCRAAPERKGTEAFKQSAVDIYREIIMENIEYDTLTQDPKMDKERLDEIVDLMLETVCSARKTLRIAGDDYPAELVKIKFLKLNSSHIEFVMDCMRENTTKIRNIKQYLRAVLFNAPSPPLSRTTWQALIGASRNRASRTIPVRRTRAYENMADLAGAPALTAAEKSKGVITVAGRSNPKDDCPCNQDGKAGRKGAASRAAEALAALPQGKGHAPSRQANAETAYAAWHRRFQYRNHRCEYQSL